MPPGPLNVSVQIFAYDEPESIGPTMDSYATQRIPGGWDVDYIAGVTPTDDRQTARKVAEHSTFRLVETPSGKLHSRNHVHNLAARSGADVIVSGDGDAPPLTGTFVRDLVAPLQEPGVVATNGFAKDITRLSPMWSVLLYADLATRPIYGRGSAFTTDAWRQAGPFRTDEIDQKNVFKIRREEEYNFRRRLEELGEVRDVPSAKVVFDNRRAVGWILNALRPVRDPDSEFWDRRGEETF